MFPLFPQIINVNRINDFYITVSTKTVRWHQLEKAFQLWRCENKKKKF